MADQKPCFVCKEPAPATFDADRTFEKWANDNQIIAPWRSRFDALKEMLEWAALDETDEGAHEQCALTWAVTYQGYSKQYPIGLKEDG